MDLQHIIDLVQREHNMTLDKNDPALAVATIVNAVSEEQQIKACEILNEIAKKINHIATHDLSEKAYLDRVGSEARHIMNIYAEQAVRHFSYRTILYAGLALVGAMLLGAGVDRYMMDDGLEHACLTQGDVRMDAKGNRYCLIALPPQTPTQTR